MTDIIKSSLSVRALTVMKNTSGFEKHIIADTVDMQNSSLPEKSFRSWYLISFPIRANNLPNTKFSMESRVRFALCFLFFFFFNLVLRRKTLMVSVYLICVRKGRMFGWLIHHV